MCKLRYLFLFIISFSIVASTVCHADRIVRFSGFDRQDVPNLSIHLLSTPSINEIKSKKIPYDAMVRFYQLDGSKYFEVNAHNTDPKIVYIDDDLNIGNSNNIPNLEIQFKNSKIRVKFNRNNTLDIIKGFTTYHTLPFVLSDPSGWYQYQIFNNSKSIVLFNNYTDELYFVADIDNPVIEKYNHDIQFDDIFSDKESKNLFLHSYSRNKDHSINFKISKLNILDNQLESDLIQINNCSTRGTTFEYIANLNLILFSNEGNLSIYNSNSGKLIHTVALTTENREIREIIRQEEDTLIVIGQDVININQGTIIGNLPGLYPISAIIVDSTKKFLYYSASTAKNRINYTKIISYDLTNHSIVKETSLNQDQSSFTTAEKLMNQIHQLFLTNDGTLLATVGTGVLYDDHIHVNE